MSFYPLDLTHKYLCFVDRYIRFADERGHTLLELAFAWLLAQRPVASVIAGATTAEQVKANVEASTWQLGAEDLAALREL